jgi:hypothetical protein
MTRRLWFLIILVLVIIPMVHPIGLPIPIETRVSDFYNTIKAAGQGGTAYGYTFTAPPSGGMNGILMGMQAADIGSFTGIRDYWVATFEYIMQQHLKMVFVGINPGGPPGVVWIMNYIQTINPALYASYPYGTDWVSLPYLPGDETAMAGIATNLWTAYSVDAVNNIPLANLPIMAQFHSLKDFTLTYAYYHIVTYAEMFVRQWPQKYGVPMIVSGTFSMVAPYYPTLVTGCIESTQQFAEFEELVNMPGLELAKMDAFNIQGIFQMGMIFAGLGVSLSMLTKPKKAKEVQKA